MAPRKKKSAGKARSKSATNGSMAAANSAAPASLEQAIGRQVRHFRTAAGLTVADLAAASGITPGMLSKVENGQISPSLTTLGLLSSALNVPVGQLFAAFDRRSNCSYVAAGDGAILRWRGTRSGHIYQLLGYLLDGFAIVEPYLVTLPEAAAPYPDFQHDGMEFIYLLSGEADYIHDGKIYRLTTGDSMLFDSSAPHGPQKLISGPVKLLSIMIHARR
jgi:transcriptional regulator with XRE-family HTH domain